MNSSDMLAILAGAANDLRQVQCELAEADPSRRADEYARVLERYLGEQATYQEKTDFLEALDERFPVLRFDEAPVPSRRQEATESADLQALRQRLGKLEAELADPFRLVGRLAEHWSGIPEAKKLEMMDMLRIRGSVPTGAVAPVPSAVSAMGSDASRTSGPVDETAGREVLKRTVGKADDRRVPSYAKLAAMVVTLLDYLGAWDQAAYGAVASLNLTSASLGLKAREDLSKAIAEFLREEADASWEAVQQRCRTTLVQRYLAAKSRQLHAQLRIVNDLVQPLQRHVEGRFAPQEVLEEVDSILSEKSGFFGAGVKWQEAVAAALERRLGVGKASGKEEDVRQSLQRLAGEALREAMSARQ